MKKLLSKKGFTIVEVMVAFVIFAIMAAMVCAIVQQTMQTKRENIELEGEIENQQVTYYGKTLDRTYDDASSENLTFNFNDVSPVNIGYSVGDPNAVDADNKIKLEYFVGDVDYNAMLGKGAPMDPTNNNSSSGSVADRFEQTNIYGSNGLTDIQVIMKRDNDYTGDGYRYFVASKAIGPEDKQYDRFKQYRIIFPAKMLSYGYADFTDASKTFTTAGVSTEYKLTLTNNSTTEKGDTSTIRISAAQTTLKPVLTKQGFTGFYVVLNKELETISPDLNLYKIFGVSSTKQDVDTKPSDGNYKFSRYVETVKQEGGSEVDITHTNVFAAVEKTKTNEGGK